MIAMHVNGATPVKIADSQGRTQTPRGKGLIVVDVLLGEDRKVWSLTGHKSHRRSPVLLNVPTVFSFDAGTMMVPKEVR
jgi:hypothetical protein